MARHDPRSVAPLHAARDQRRVRHSELRLRMVTGEWRDDLRLHVAERVGEVRAAAWGPPSVIACPLRDLAAAVAVLYRQEPVVSQGDAALAGLAEELTARLSASGLWLIRAQSQRLTEALNESAVRVDVVDGRLTYRIVPPTMLRGVSRPGMPGVPDRLEELQMRDLPDGAAWCWDVLDVSDPSAPHYRIVQADGDHRGRDVTEAVLGQRYEGADYPYRYADGRPFIPYQLDHASGAPLALWEPWARSETVDGTMQAGVLAALIDHAALQAAWPQRYAVGVQPAGASEQTTTTGQPVSTVVADPTAIMLFEALEADRGGQPLIGQWQTGADLGAMQDLYERRLGMLAQTWGLSPSDLIRSGADPRSGVALSLSRAGIREVQQALAPVYRGGDERLVRISAALLNRALGTDYPESGWSVRYELLPLSAQEQEQLTRETLDLLSRGLISAAEARARVLGEDLSVATSRLPVTSTTTPSTTP